jgi:NAD(P)H dehydrogenase (quinone)
MSNSKILVTGATGLHGGVGGHTARLLREKGADVRALVRSRDHRSEALEKLGIDTVVGDFMNLQSLREAMIGVDRVLFCYPINVGLLEAALNMAIAARDARLRLLIDLSLIPAREGSPSDEAREHWLVSQMFDSVGLNVLHLMGGFFYENLEFLAGPDMVKRGVLQAPFGDGDTPLAWVAGEDVARFASAVLLQPDQYVGGTRYVTGPECLTFRQVAEIASVAFGKPIRYDGGISIEAWARRLNEHRLANDRLVKHASVLAYAFGKTKTSFGQATNEVSSASGVAPMSLKEYLSCNRAVFGV